MNSRWRCGALALLLCLPLRAGAVGTGEEAPAFALPRLGAPGRVELTALRGSVVYLDFWASWCGPCRVSFPQLEQLRDEYGQRGFEVLAVNLDEREEDALAFVAEVPVSYPVLRDATGATPRAYGVLGMPTGYLLDREGVVRLVHRGYRRGDGDRLREAILRLLEGAR